MQSHHNPDRDVRKRTPHFGEKWQNASGVQISNTGAQPVAEDALAYLPCSTVLEFSKGLEIYGPGNPSAGIYLVIEGRVKQSRVDDSGTPVVIDILQVDDFFGESALVVEGNTSEQASALENTKVMSWSVAEIERLVGKDPRLAIALMQVVVRRSVDFTRRLESFSMEGTAQRLARSLIQFANRAAGGAAGGAITIAPLTHELLAQYVGTSREIVSHHMSDFRTRGYIKYSRRGITVHRDAMRAWLQLKTNRV